MCRDLPRHTLEKRRRSTASSALTAATAGAAIVVDANASPRRAFRRKLRAAPSSATYKPDTDSQREALRLRQEVRRGVPGRAKGLLFFGPPGVGKTHLAVGILKDVIRDKGARGFFFETTELLRLVRETYNRSVEETEMEVLRPVLEADLLVLDDLGAEKTSEWVQETLGLVVNTRYNARRATIFTSNLRDPILTTPIRIRSCCSSAPARARACSRCASGSRSRAPTSARWVPTLAGRHRQTLEGHLARRRRRTPTNGEAALAHVAAQARAQLKAPGKGDAELKWTGGKAGS